MNESRIENLLSKAPRPVPPATLESKLKSDIRLQQKVQRAPMTALLTTWLRQWIPITACVVAATALAIQGTIAMQLKRQNEQMRSSLKVLEEARVTSDGAEELQLLLAELTRLRKESQELSQIQVEIASLRQDIADAEGRLQENRRVQEEQAQANAAIQLDPFAEEKAEAKVTACVNYMKILGVGARVWMVDNEGKPNAVKGQYPSSFSQFTNEVGSARVFFCPADPEKRRNATWDDVDQGRSSYIFVTPGASEYEPDVVLFRCPHHGSVTLADGSVQKNVLLQDFKIGRGNRLERK